MRFTSENEIPVKDRRRKRKTHRYGGALGMLGAAVAALANTQVLHMFPASWQPYIIGGSVVAIALGALDKLERSEDGRRYLRRLQHEGTGQ